MPYMSVSEQRKPWRCRLGRHIGQESGGTLMFTCPRCGGSYWQSLKHYDRLQRVSAAADLMIAAGRADEALKYTQDEVRRIVS
jgi:hypothetical protein